MLELLAAMAAETRGGHDRAPGQFAHLLRADLVADMARRLTTARRKVLLGRAEMERARYHE